MSQSRRGPATRAFRETIAGPDTPVVLERCAALVATHHHDVDPDDVLAGLDHLADRVIAAAAAPSFDDLRAFLFVDEGFGPALDRYDDPANSMLDRVLARRIGIPISLSIVMIAVGRRVGVPVDPVGMPGHFLVADPARPGVWCDPFAGGALLDLDGCRARFDAVFGGRQRFDPSMLAATPTRAVVARVLANLENGPLARDLVHLAWIMRLRASIPGTSLGELLALAARLERIGMHEDAAVTFDRVATAVGGDDADALHRQARAARASFN